jgi:hypothetical protein
MYVSYTLYNALSNLLGPSALLDVCTNNDTSKYVSYMQTVITALKTSCKAHLKL